MNILKAALKYYQVNVLAVDDEAQDLINMIKEAEELDQLMQKDNEIWPNEIRFISISSSCDLGNRVLYDTYGKLARANDNKEVAFDDFVVVARKEFGCETLTNSVIRNAWEIVSELWHDNDALDSHNADGTFDSMK